MTSPSNTVSQPPPCPVLLSRRTRKTYSSFSSPSPTTSSLRSIPKDYREQLWIISPKNSMWYALWTLSLAILISLSCSFIIVGEVGLGIMTNWKLNLQPHTKTLMSMGLARKEGMRLLMSSASFACKSTRLKKQRMIREFTIKQLATLPMVTLEVQSHSSILNKRLLLLW